ncbi:uncharacterized protein [Macrobrachium rosenbergii]|uniref:uncharacterized protein n=1 Tax=Macrobrachium rosenbergii TaxID=79674 RepID=UPI0034D5BDF3
MPQIKTLQEALTSSWDRNLCLSPTQAIHEVMHLQTPRQACLPINRCQCHLQAQSSATLRPSRTLIHHKNGTLVSDVDPPQEGDPVPDPDHEKDPPPGDPGPITALILATCEPPAPNTSSSPNLSPEDEPLVDQTATLFWETRNWPPQTQRLRLYLLRLSQQPIRSPLVASEVTPDFAPTSPSGLSQSQCFHHLLGLT